MEESCIGADDVVRCVDIVAINFATRGVLLFFDVCTEQQVNTWGL